nr:conserved hypothetical protein [uncultured bacterium]
MKLVIAVILSLVLTTIVWSKVPSSETQVRKTVQTFYDAFNAHGFERATEYTTEDWNHINPFGGITRGREETLKDLRAVHASFLKGVTDTVEEMSVRFATRDVAVVNVISRMSTYTTPDGITRQNERHFRTFVVVKRNGRWLIMQDQNTTVAGRN